MKNLITCLVVTVLSGAVAADVPTFFAEQLLAEWHTPELGTVIESHTFIVDSSVELPSSKIENNDNFYIDIDADTIHFHFTGSVIFNSFIFNGWKFTDSLNTVSPIIGFELVSSNPTMTIETGWNPDSVWANFEGRSFQHGYDLIFQVSFWNPQIWTVDDDGKADFNNIQAAVDAASDGDEIIVMPGIYTGTGNQVVDMLGKAVWLHSSGAKEAAIIDGEGTRKGITCNTEETIETVIEGFTVTNCYAQHGGGIDCVSSNPLLRNCKFVNSEAYLYGGGMRVLNSSPTLEGCLFSGNTAFRGGGIACHDGHSIIENCTVENNIASDGGGIWCDAVSNPLLTGNVICSNELNNISGPWTDKGENIITASCNDQDSDNVQDDIDNCYLYNPDQLDCNGNDVGDVCDIADGTSTDWNGNEIPDDCECLADINTDGNVNVHDILTLIANWGSASDIGDVNQDGIVDVTDLLIVIGNWGPCE